MRIGKRQVAFRLLLALPALLGLAFIMSGCLIGTYQDGTITGELIGADSFNGVADFVFFVFPQGADAFSGTPVGESPGGLTISGGVAQGTAVDYPTGSFTVIFQGGDNFFLFGFIDENNNGALDTGEEYGYSYLFTVSGDMLVIMDEAGFLTF
jgi:hypothetical protein